MDGKIEQRKGDGMDTPITREEHEESINFGNTVIPIEYSYIYIPIGQRERIFNIMVKEENLKNEDIRALKENKNPIYLFENGKLKDTLEGYNAGFILEYGQGIYKIQLLYKEKEKNTAPAIDYEKPSLVRFVEKIILGKAKQYG